jgi:hypothetical protein
MTRLGKRLFAVVLVIIVTGSIVVDYRGIVRRQIVMIRSCDHSKLLVDSRSLLRAYGEEDSEAEPGVSERLLVLDPSKSEMEQAIPDSIRALAPSSLIVFNDRLEIRMPYSSVFVAAFEDGAQQRGSEKLTNGLWIVYGSEIKRE